MVDMLGVIDATVIDPGVGAAAPVHPAGLRVGEERRLGGVVGSSLAAISVGSPSIAMDFEEADRAHVLGDVRGVGEVLEGGVGRHPDGQRSLEVRHACLPCPATAPLVAIAGTTLLPARRDGLRC